LSFVDRARYDLRLDLRVAVLAPVRG